MRALVIYCHPSEESYTAAVRDRVLTSLADKNAEVRLIDLYEQGFDPVLSPAEHQGYMTSPDNTAPVLDHVEALRWCDTLIFVYPTWWYGLPAILKGWLDRVLLPDVAFQMPTDAVPAIRPGLQHITRIGAFTTCGASRWLTTVIGAPGRRTLLRGVGFLCAPKRKTVFLAHYKMDGASKRSLARHLNTVSRKMETFLS